MTASHLFSLSKSTPTPVSPRTRTGLVKFDYDGSDAHELSVLAKEVRRSLCVANGEWHFCLTRSSMLSPMVMIPIGLPLKSPRPKNVDAFHAPICNLMDDSLLWALIVFRTCPPSSLDSFPLFFVISILVYLAMTDARGLDRDSVMFKFRRVQASSFRSSNANNLGLNALSCQIIFPSSRSVYDYEELDPGEKNGR